MEKREYVVDKEFAGIRLDKAISDKDTNLSRAMVQKLLDDEEILVNGKKVKASYKLNVNDIVEIEKTEPKEIDIKTERRRFLCPLCGKSTVLWLLPNTEIKNLPIKCKRCGKESIVNVEPLTKP